MKGFIHSIETFGAVDGPGIRYVVFMQGCPLRCLFCHNPDSWKINSGKKMSVGELIKDIKSYENYIKDGGVTFSGGEPLLQAEFVEKTTKKLKKMGFHVAIDTAGTIPLEKSQKAIELCDLVLLDVKAFDSALYQTITGGSDLNNKATLEFCEKIKKPVWVRHVVVPSYTLDEKHLESLAIYLSKFSCIENVELLPFHKMGEFKWKELGFDYKLYETQPPTQEEMEKVKAIFRKYNLPVK